MAQLSDYVTKDEQGNYVVKSNSYSVQVKGDKIFIGTQLQKYDKVRDESITGGTQTQEGFYSPEILVFNPQGQLIQRQEQRLISTRGGTNVTKQAVVPVREVAYDPKTGQAIRQQRYIVKKDDDGSKFKVRTEERYYEQQEQEARRIREGRKVGESRLAFQRRLYNEAQAKAQTTQSLEVRYLGLEATGREESIPTLKATRTPISRTILSGDVPQITFFTEPQAFQGYRVSKPKDTSQEFLSKQLNKRSEFAFFPKQSAKGKAAKAAFKTASFAKSVGEYSEAIAKAERKREAELIDYAKENPVKATAIGGAVVLGSAGLGVAAASSAAASTFISGGSIAVAAGTVGLTGTAIGLNPDLTRKEKVAAIGSVSTDVAVFGALSGAGNIAASRIALARATPRLTTVESSVQGTGDTIFNPIRGKAGRQVIRGTQISKDFGKTSTTTGRIGKETTFRIEQVGKELQVEVFKEGKFVTGFVERAKLLTPELQPSATKTLVRPKTAKVPVETTLKTTTTKGTIDYKGFDLQGTQSLKTRATGKVQTKLIEETVTKGAEAGVKLSFQTLKPSETTPLLRGKILKELGLDTKQIQLPSTGKRLPKTEVGFLKFDGKTAYLDTAFIKQTNRVVSGSFRQTARKPTIREAYDILRSETKARGGLSALDKGTAKVTGYVKGKQFQYRVMGRERGLFGDKTGSLRPRTPTTKQFKATTEALSQPPKVLQIAPTLARIAAAGKSRFTFTPLVIAKPRTGQRTQLEGRQATIIGQEYKPKAAEVPALKSPEKLREVEITKVVTIEKPVLVPSTRLTPETTLTPQVPITPLVPLVPIVPTTPPTTPPPALPPIIRPNLGGLTTRSFNLQRKQRQQKEYAPTLTAAAFNITAKEAKIGEVSGLGLRPIKRKKKKKR